MKIRYDTDYAKKKYKELQNKKPEHLTDKQKDFMVDMYHQEETEAGLLWTMMKY